MLRRRCFFFSPVAHGTVPAHRLKPPRRKSSSRFRALRVSSRSERAQTRLRLRVNAVHRRARRRRHAGRAKSLVVIAELRARRRIADVHRADPGHGGSAYVHVRHLRSPRRRRQRALDQQHRRNHRGEHAQHDRVTLAGIPAVFQMDPPSRSPPSSETRAPVFRSTAARRVAVDYDARRRR